MKDYHTHQYPNSIAQPCPRLCTICGQPEYIDTTAASNTKLVHSFTRPDGVIELTSIAAFEETVRVLKEKCQELSKENQELKVFKQSQEEMQEQLFSLIYDAALKDHREEMGFSFDEFVKDFTIQRNK